MTNINSEQWNRNAVRLQESALSRLHRRRAISLMRFYELMSDKSAAILDVGCGSGFFLKEFSQHGYSSLFGIEPEACLSSEIPREIAEVRNDRATAIGYPDQSFNAIFIYSVLQYLKSPSELRTACEEIDRVLKPGGYVFIMEPGRVWLTKAIGAVAKVLSPFSDTWAALAEVISEDRSNVARIISERPSIRLFFGERNYRSEVDRHFLFNWVFTIRKRSHATSVHDR